MSEVRACDVHVAVDNDSTPRECEFCERCQAWICLDDIKRLDRRILAMVKMWGNAYGPRNKPKAALAGKRCNDCGKDNA
jgi:hypothetical protein